MAPRLEFDALLRGVLGSDNVYFQPPSNLQMSYPCIVYQRDNEKAGFADNKPYSYARRYAVTYIDRNPDSDIPDKIGQLPLSSFNRAFTADNLHHYVHTIYF